MFYTTDAPGLSIDASPDPAPFSVAEKSSHPAEAEHGGWIGFTVLAMLMAMGFAGLTFGSIKLAEGAILSQQSIFGPALMR
ncbi:hypothetical protein [Leptolyngbya sp. O-77]|uniref:hypothetical protein n=1 Tax=Leptolyngbya sp. O-77 TaxID=1080068 RepID=UPI00074D36A7|nr:hypothetical protein [Leptolyngbya sp. O-77]BAU40342.1 hypothetical protein O77CONTIG1_00139 [Leptolyngbya sp. O-77]